MCGGVYVNSSSQVDKRIVTLQTVKWEATPFMQIASQRTVFHIAFVQVVIVAAVVPKQGGFLFY